MLDGRFAMLICPYDESVSDLFSATLTSRTPHPDVNSAVSLELILTNDTLLGGSVRTIA
jgi:hypothetical protein